MRHDRFFCMAALAVALSIPGGHAAPSKPVSSVHASAVPASVSYEGTFLKTLARAPQAPSDWHPLQDKYGRFAIAVPSDWTEGTPPPDQENLMYALVAGEIQPRDSFSANIVVSQTQAPPKFQMKPSMVADLAAQTVKGMKTYHYVVKDKAFTTIDGIPCAIVGGTLEVDNRTLRNLQLRLVHRGVNYLITFTALDKYYGQYEPLFARLVKTLVFEREGGLPSPLSSPSPSVSPSGAPSAAPHTAPSANPRPAPSANPRPAPSASPRP